MFSTSPKQRNNNSRLVLSNSMSSSFNLDQDLTHRNAIENNTIIEGIAVMDRDTNAEYLTQNRFEENDCDVNRVQRSAELSFGIALLVLGFILELAGVTPNQRPIPAQQLQNGDYFYNLTNNERYNGQTVPGRFSLDQKYHGKEK